MLWNNKLITLPLLKLQSGVLVWTIVGTKLPHLCLLVLFNKLLLIFTCVCVSLPVKKLIYLRCTCWHHELETTQSAFWQVTTMIRILRDFKPILDPICPRKELQSQKLTSGWLICQYIQYVGSCLSSSLLNIDQLGKHTSTNGNYVWMYIFVRPLAKLPLSPLVVKSNSKISLNWNC